MAETQNAGTRLRNAALELFQTHGYDRTTAAEIAARAGVTERTFFRYYSDKREVLFDGEAMVQATLVTSVDEAPVDLGPLDALFWAFRAFRPVLEERSPYAKARQAIITVTPALQERELAKLEALAYALADALRTRNVAELPAVLAARTGLAAFVHATVSWLDDPEIGFLDHLELTRRELSKLLVAKN